MKNAKKQTHANKDAEIKKHTHAQKDVEIEKLTQAKKVVEIETKKQLEVIDNDVENEIETHKQRGF